ncbi:hypothetical protein SOVF_082190 [Spinacia oleracea]|nr:hypothetical protein SOVF_082190 [Spinacia oleracea]
MEECESLSSEPPNKSKNLNFTLQTGNEPRIVRTHSSFRTFRGTALGRHTLGVLSNLHKQWSLGKVTTAYF